ADNLATIQSYIHKHPHELLDSVVKERFDQAFRLNRGRAFYSSPSHCQAVFFENLFSTQPLAASINLHLSSAGGESYSVQNRCQPPLSTAPDQSDRSHQQDSTTTPPARRTLLESATSTTLNLKQLADLQELLAEDRARSGAHYRGLKV
ncbi:hypothetical protein, partial [Stutzerimonas degradans]|uniref:hypothetical protein n=1 Tax=Stutzerimonas degradans TaxID=2968968 RepID=UPI0015B42D33